METLLHKSYNTDTLPQLAKKDLCTVFNEKNEPTKKHSNPIKYLEQLKNPGILRLLVEIMHLKDVYRRGWLLEGRDIPHEKCESVADHSFGVAILALFIASEYFPDLDLEKLVIMAIIHELGEIHYGDVTPGDKVSKEVKHQREKEGVIKILYQLSNGQKYIDIWLEFEAQETQEAIFVRQMDKLEMIIQAAIYRNHYDNKALQEFLNRNQIDIQLEELVNILEKVREMF